MKTLEKIDIENNFLIKDKRGISLIIRNKKSGVSLKKSFLISMIIHPIAIILFLFLLLQISVSFLEKPAPKIRNIDFVIVSPENKEKPKFQKIKENYTGEKNKPQSKTIIPMSKKHYKGFKQPPKSSNTLSIPLSKIKPLSSDIGFGADGPVGYSSPTASSSSLISSGNGAAGNGRRKGNGASFGNAGVGTPKVANSSSSFDGILKDPDLTPYISNLERKIRSNWTHPKTDDSKIVVIFLRIGKDGKLLVLNVKNTSSNPDTDNAAINAVKKTLPFRALPSEFRENYLDLIFKFDYNVLSVKSK
jgi:membrane protein involved in colicin uptake